MHETLADVLAASPPSPVMLQQLTDRLRLQQDGKAGPDPLPAGDLATAVLGTLDDRLSPREVTLLHEIAGLARIIEHAKAEIAEVSLCEIRGSHIPLATGELDAIVEHTAIATNNILESCESLDLLIGNLTAQQVTVVQAATTKIYEACSFQDITGQRITKVVNALKEIEAKVLRLSGAGAGAGERADLPVVRPPVATGPASLLNGPMLPRDAMGQDEIDKLLSDFA